MTKQFINVFNASVGSVQQGDQNSASVSHNTIESEDDGLIWNERKKILPNEHRGWSFELERGDKIKFLVDSDEPVDMYLTDAGSYENWRNGLLLAAYQTNKDKCRSTGQFTAPRTGEYFVAVINEGENKTKVDILVSLIQKD